MAAIRVEAGHDGDGNVAAWSYRHVSPSITQQRGRLKPGAADGQATEGSTGLPYSFGTRLVEYVPHTAAIPVGYWRSVGHSLNAFAVESAVDELAELAGSDPLTFRRRLLAGHPRALAVVEEAAKLSPWRDSLPSGHAWGMAFAESFGSLVCQIVDVSATSSSLRVHRVACAVDCGTAINPASVEMQMQGGIVHGLAAALWGQMGFSNGQASARNFNAYSMLRMRDMPDVTVSIVSSPGESLGGIGEPGVPPIAPAVANAYYRLTGSRVRSLPFFTVSTSRSR